jgi:AcrR family transcriptional regulator
VTAPSSDSLRADARRNRRQLIDAAARAFAEDGGDVPMEEIARRAGVGVGTLYRRFPDRDALVLAVAQDSLQGLVTQVREAVEQEPRAWDALVRSISYSRELKLSVRPASSVSSTAAAAVRSDPVIVDLRQQFAELLTRLVDAAQREGSIRADVGAGDVVHLFALVYRATETRASGTADLAARRALGVVLDGLRVGPHGDLPGHPLSPDDLAQR